MPNPAHIMITGAAGFVGARTAKLALEAGHRVTALVRSTNAPRLAGLSTKLNIVIADLSHSNDVAEIVADLRPNVIIHSAWEGVGGPLRDGEIQIDNIRTSVALADAGIKSGIRKFIGIGSQAEYGRFNRRITETDLPHPTMLYGAAKLATCQLIRQRCEAADISFSWMRLFSVYGPGDNPNWLIPAALSQLLSGVAPRLTAGTQRWDYLHIDDVAAAIFAVATFDDASGIFNLSSGIATPVKTIIEILRDNTAPDLDLKFGEIPFGPAQIMHLEGDNIRLMEAANWSPKIKIQDGLIQLASAARTAS